MRSINTCGDTEWILHETHERCDMGDISLRNLKLGKQFYLKTNDNTNRSCWTNRSRDSVFELRLFSAARLFIPVGVTVKVKRLASSGVATCTQNRTFIYTVKVKNLKYYSFWRWDWNIPGEIGQYHGYWCPGSLRRQIISSHGIDSVGHMCSCFPWGTISTTCAISVSRNEEHRNAFLCLLM